MQSRYRSLGQRLQPLLFGLHLERRGFKPYVQEVLDGNGERVYEHLKDLPAGSVDKKA